MSEQKKKRIKEQLFCDYCDSNITNKVQIRDTEKSCLFLCLSCANAYDQQNRDEFIERAKLDG